MCLRRVRRQCLRRYLGNLSGVKRRSSGLKHVVGITCLRKAWLYDFQGCGSTTSTPPGASAAASFLKTAFRPRSPACRWIHLHTDSSVMASALPAPTSSSCTLPCRKRADCRALSSAAAALPSEGVSPSQSGRFSSRSLAALIAKPRFFSALPTSLGSMSTPSVILGRNCATIASVMTPSWQPMSSRRRPANQLASISASRGSRSNAQWKR
mmetsp:Transcript_18995/g.47957  ORF Transcript_18995/g.47957 Transcript_18995/m.47957 type:complete len:211 (+) Transcript_18995:510-1142(+)